MASAAIELTLPDFGENWLNGCRDQYVIISLKHSAHGFVMFFQANDTGYTHTLVNAGRYTKKQVMDRLWYYNDGSETVAVPLTYDALTMLGIYHTVIDVQMLDKFLSREVPTQDGAVG